MNEEQVTILFKNHTFNTIYMQRYVWNFLPDYEESLVGIQNYLIVILSMVGESSVSELADILGKRENTVTKTINKLEKLGLVQRRSSTSDRRVTYISLTDKCKELDGKIASETIKKIKDYEEQENLLLTDEDYATLCRCVMQMNEVFAKVDKIGPLCIMKKHKDE